MEDVHVLVGILQHLFDSCTSKDIKNSIQKILSTLTLQKSSLLREKIKLMKNALDQIKDLVADLDRKSWAKGIIKTSSIKTKKQDLTKLFYELQCGITILQISIYSSPQPKIVPERKLIIWRDDNSNNNTTEINKLSKSGIEIVQVTSDKKALSTIKKNLEFIRNNPESVRIITSYINSDEDKGTENLIKSIHSMKLNIPILIYSNNKEESLNLALTYPFTLYTWKKSLLTIFCESILNNETKKTKKSKLKQKEVKSNEEKMDIESTENIDLQEASTLIIDETEVVVDQSKKKSNSVNEIRNSTKSSKQIGKLDSHNQIKTPEVNKKEMQQLKNNINSEDLLDDIMNVESEKENNKLDSNMLHRTSTLTITHSQSTTSTQYLKVADRLFEATSSAINGDFNKITAGKLFSFEIILHGNTSEEKPYVFLTGPVYLEGFTSKLANGKYKCQFFPTRIGEYYLYILFGQAILDCTPYPIIVKSEDGLDDNFNTRPKRVRNDENEITKPLKKAKKSELMFFDDDEDDSFFVDNKNENDSSFIKLFEEGKKDGDKNDDLYSLLLDNDEEESSDSEKDSRAKLKKKASQLFDEEETQKTQVIDDYVETQKTQVIEGDTQATQIISNVETQKTQIIDGDTQATQIISDTETQKTQIIDDYNVETQKTQIIDGDTQATQIISDIETQKTQIIEDDTQATQIIS